MRHANLAIFVPHAGCPRQCSFCNQKSISGAREAPTGKSVAALCAESARALAGTDTDAEIAFFGGSFTAIGRDYMLELLEAAAPFVGGAFRGIRISTRPDAVDGETLGLLRRYGVTAVELGAQSMDDGVLDQNLRGYTADDVERAAGLVREAGFELGLQMMTGLYGSDEARDFMTAERLAACAPDTVRVYPTVVMEGTGLAALWRAGAYRPQTLEEAVSLGARLLEFFEGKGVRVIRMGLHAQDSLERERLAGPYHPAFRELCEGEAMRRRAEALLAGRPEGEYLLRVGPRSLSKITGHGARTVEKLGKLGYHVKIEPDGRLSGLAIEIKEV